MSRSPWPSPEEEMAATRARFKGLSPRDAALASAVVAAITTRYDDCGRSLPGWYVRILRNFVLGYVSAERLYHVAMTRLHLPRIDLAQRDGTRASLGLFMTQVEEDIQSLRGGVLEGFAYLVFAQRTRAEHAILELEQKHLFQNHGAAMEAITHKVPLLLRHHEASAAALVASAILGPDETDRRAIVVIGTNGDASDLRVFDEHFAVVEITDVAYGNTMIDALKLGIS